MEELILAAVVLSSCAVAGETYFARMLGGGMTYVGSAFAIRSLCCWAATLRLLMVSIELAVPYVTA
eukprot:CAMPEP_0174292282 /NCGR_PEP_ID=MMETSP0809-20121228/34954_1 /TAXON_ID=73025 ORGANISM="Eutreptiella gymnastica-like, Strain CCMP1594" /NCGR_SAMPLE_ID=MMETSP0809 /ASSEMBLY_ACC=CAM_ASM_000658 /LENGTH=65 /DNA_ID=CAMNT_0015392255 /DNA_START=138 /DNA_END=335 /DNA_ORIENTATION=-